MRPHFVDSPEPSPLSHEILNGRPYTYLDDAPLEERRTRAVALRRGLPDSARELGRLDPDAIARVRDEARPDPRDAEELHDALLELVVLRPEAQWSGWFDELCRAGRAAVAGTVEGALWLATERREHVDALFPGAAVEPDVRLPASSRSAGRPEIDEEAATVAATRGHLATLGPATAADLAGRMGRPVSAVEQALARLEAEGFALRGRFDPERDEGDRDVEFCERRLLARIHRYTTDRLRREIEPVTAQDFMRFLLRWQHVAPETQMEGRRGLLAVIEQLQGFEVAAGSWEEAVLPARVAGYRPEWLDDLCLSGEVAWGRFTARAANGAGDAPGEETGGRGGAVPSRATPVTFALRDNLDWLLRAARGPARPAPPGDGAARDILEALRTRGALFYNDLAAVTGRLRVEVEEGLWDLVSRGLVTADGFGSVRALLTARERWAKRAARPRGGRLRRGAREIVVGAEGRWSIFMSPEPLDAEGGADVETLAEAVGRAASRALRRRLPRSRDAREPRGALARNPTGRSAAWRRAAPRAGAASSPGSSASSTRCPTPSRRCARLGAASARARPCASPPSIR